MSRSRFNNRKILSFIVCRPDDQAQIIIDGVESEQVEEENDALNDMRAELGEKHIIEKVSQYF